MLAPYLAQADSAFSFELAIVLLGTLCMGYGAWVPMHLFHHLFVSAALGIGLIMSHPKEKMSLF